MRLSYGPKKARQFTIYPLEKKLSQPPIRMRKAALPGSKQEAAEKADIEWARSIPSASR